MPIITLLFLLVFLNFIIIIIIIISLSTISSTCPALLDFVGIIVIDLFLFSASNH